VKLITDGYETRDLGDITYALGVKIERSKNGDIRLSQRSYIESTLSKYGLTECRIVTTSLDHGVKMSKRDGPSLPDEKAEMVVVPYRRLVGSLMHLAIYTTPDIIYAVTKLSQFNSNPGRIHWNQVKHLLRYLRGTKEYALRYTAGATPEIQIYSDADDRRSYSEMVITTGQSIIH